MDRNLHFLDFKLSIINLNSFVVKGHNEKALNNIHHLYTKQPHASLHHIKNSQYVYFIPCHGAVQNKSTDDRHNLALGEPLWSTSFYVFLAFCDGYYCIYPFSQMSICNICYNIIFWNSKKRKIFQLQHLLHSRIWMSLFYNHSQKQKSYSFHLSI